MDKKLRHEGSFVTCQSGFCFCKNNNFTLNLKAFCPLFFRIETAKKEGCFPAIGLTAGNTPLF